MYDVTITMVTGKFSDFKQMMTQNQMNICSDTKMVNCSASLTRVSIFISILCRLRMRNSRRLVSEVPK